jgi:fructose-1,6-bisphosphatase/inositol monophosphatase family enzyme
VGEELPPVLDGDPSLVWLVDPHDGTSEFLRGARGSSVSVALLRDGVPVLGIVHAPLSPDRGSDVIGWAEGMDHLIRNGAPVPPRRVDGGLGAEEVVLLAYRSYARPETNIRRVAPARFMSSNSIAYRLARIAAGDAVATVSRQAKLAAYDYAAGHALLRGAGCVFVDGAGREPVYGPNGSGGMDKCFAGSATAVRTLLGRDWSLGSNPEPPIAERVTLSWPRSNRGLDRAIGCLAGLAIGEGSAADGLPGQPGPVAERAILLARDLIAGQAGDIVGVPPAALTPLGITGGRTPYPGAGPFLAAIACGIAGGTREDMLRMGQEAGSGAMPDKLRQGFGLLDRGAGLDAASGTSAAGGALLGAAAGRAALPDSALRLLLTCRVLHSAGASQPRPPECWADDLPLVAEALLALG